MSKFKIILLVVFGVFILAAVLVFSLSRGSGSTTSSAVVWGTMPSTTFNQYLSDSGLLQDKTVSIIYVQKSESTLDTDFTEALAEGKGPDLVILPQDMIWKERNKLTPIPYASVTQADFQSTFADEASLLVGPTGTYALPLYIDPMVLYTNKTLLSSAGTATPISYWDELYAATTMLTKKDGAGNITQSAIALGTTSNVPNAKDILSLLMIQAGTPITRLTANGLQSELSSSEGLPTVPATAAVDFYTQFSNPEKTFYTWNRSLLPAQTDFVSGSTAYYIGYASEYGVIRAKAPTLSLGVSKVPQSRVSGVTQTFGRMWSVAISKGSLNPTAALTVALSMISSTAAGALAKDQGLPPARRDLLSVKQNDPAEAVFFTSAVQSSGWLDPDDAKSGTIFTSLIDNVTSGRSDSASAVQSANSSLSALITSTQ